ncbi:unnamed protein product [Lactuca virosa]|uniref:Uncharacterized protein n=1 Tax=Lactuca virosa TaxID=75947 RepID=A0AAU9LU97_9ASTR|nr:unnamed protein product [Lactuca virosa]
MSSDTSTRSVKKKKMSTKALVKRLIGVVADLTSKVDRVLQKKDEQDTWFGEEEDMVNEEEEETYYHGTQLEYDDTSTPGLKRDVGRTPMHVEPSPDVGEHHKKTVTPIMQSTPKLKKITKPRKKGVKSPEKAKEDIVNEQSNYVSNHLLLDSLYAASSIPHKRCWCRLVFGNATFKYLEKLDVIEYWNDFPDRHKVNATVEFVDIVHVPQ